MSHITSLATAFTGSYASATSLSSPGDAPSLTLCSRQMSAHYGPNLCAFTLGSIHQIPDAATAAAGTFTHLSKLAASGVGTDIRMVKSTIREVSGTSAVVFVTWEIRSKKVGVADWRWKNVYGFRAGVDGVVAGADGEEETEAGGKGHWEWINSDNEITELLKRVPNYFQL